MRHWNRTNRALSIRKFSPVSRVPCTSPLSGELRLLNVTRYIEIRNGYGGGSRRNEEIFGIDCLKQLEAPHPAKT